MEVEVTVDGPTAEIADLGTLLTKRRRWNVSLVLRGEAEAVDTMRVVVDSGDDLTFLVLSIGKWLMARRGPVTAHLKVGNREVVLDSASRATAFSEAARELIGARDVIAGLSPGEDLAIREQSLELRWPASEVVSQDRIVEAAIGLAMHDHLRHARASSPRLTPVSIYLENAATSSRVEAALKELAAAFELQDTGWEPGVRGSWFRKLLLRGKELSNTQIAREIGGELRRGVELHGLHLAQAEVDEKKAAAVSGLIEALADQPNAAIMIGSILLLKAGGVLTVRELTQQEIAHMERNPSLLREPASLLVRLQDMSLERPRAIEDVQ
ncbi:effector-associated constant component EACC1 [Nonomuraea jabiensis]|uniref:Uncharacterized protein n=1 Tax=Nonomuraea jabiensis TaxID=882448 RepID=A0A7W9FY43_9ACTN|nr:hypothetical protein [Nonomuraea jabiensis]MBB5773719.1 hypothetical protein [Nonomuraea jabiensis]